ncbi:histidine kinase [Mucilaginibacter ginsenosidivorax]|uniref:Histidine kinase n=2 Tax=Mucilaginibacter ginsenosidivorax TaxID=862126 RepID=A0A5B8W3R7_9SPHI|nr:histidine kinase [Mucilaginibacter ginsenosidivorax]
MHDKNNIIGLNLYNKKFRIWAHVCVWLVLMALPYIMHSINVLPSRTFTGKEMSGFIKLDYAGYFYWIAAFYFNSLILIPHLFMKGKYPYYVLAVLSIYAIYLFVYHYIYNWLEIDLPYGLLRTSWLRLPAFLLTMAASLAYTTINGLLDYQEKLREKDKEKLKTELSFLRSQISPHFIFNVLNNIVSLVRLNSTELEPTVMKLSGLMKYMLYHTDEEKVNIKVEEEYLNHYIDLQKQRFGKKVKVETSFTILNKNQLIEPMLLIPFVENAFKHGVGSIDDPRIIIELVTDERFLNFTVINKYNALNTGPKDESSGIGIANVSRRINLLYENKHQLSIKSENNCFEVNLILKLDA